MTVRDFMNYLIYVEHAAENLQFFLWYRDYEKRFKTANSADLALAPEWTQAMEDETIAKIRKENLGQRRREPAAAEMFKGTDFEKPAREPFADTGNSNPFSTPPTSSSGYEEGSLYSGQNHSPSTYTSSYKTQAAEAFQAAGAKQPCKSYVGLECLIERSNKGGSTDSSHQSQSSHSAKRSIE